MNTQNLKRINYMRRSGASNWEILEFLTAQNKAKKVSIEAIPFLNEMLKNPNKNIRQKAVYIVSGMKSEAKEVVPKLIPLLREKNIEIRHEAILGLGKMKGEARKALPFLIKIVLDSKEESELRYDAAQAIVIIGDSDTEAIEAIETILKKTKNATVHWNIVDSMVKHYAIFPQLLPSLLGSAFHFKNPDSNIFLALIILFGFIGKDDPKVVSLLIESVSNSENEENIRLESAKTLGKIGISTSYTPELSKVLSLSHFRKEYEAGKIVSTIDPQEKKNIPLLISLLENKNLALGVEASKMLGRFAEGAKEAVSALIKVVEIKDSWFFFSKKRWAVRLEAATALGKIGKDATEAVPAIIDLFQEKGNPNPARCVESLGRIGAKKAIPFLSMSLFDPDDDLRSECITALGLMGKEAEKAVPDLLQILEDEMVGKRFRKKALRALCKIQKGVDEIVALLEISLRDQQKELCQKLIEILGYFYKETKIIPLLLKTIESDMRNVREETAKTIGKIGINSEEVRLALKKATKDSQKKVRKEAEEALRFLNN